MSDALIDLALLPAPRHFWRCRLAKGAPWVPVVTFNAGPLIDGEILDRGHRWQALVRLETTSRAILFGNECPIECDGIGLRNLESITEAEWRYLRDHAAFATAHAPHMPDAQPKKKIDVRGPSVW